MPKRVSKKRRVGRGAKRLARGVAGLAKPRYHIVAVSRDGYVKRFPVRGVDIFEVLSKIKSRLGFLKQFYRVSAGKYTDADNEWMIYITEAPALADIFESASRDTLGLLFGKAPARRRG